MVVGGGGREHALVWKISQSRDVNTIYCAPGNSGTARLAQNLDIGADNIEGLVNFARRNDVGLTVVGPEAPLCAGIVDAFNAAGLGAFGPNKQAAQLEGSKGFMKETLTRAGVPTARYEKHDNRDSAIDSLERFGDRVVVKADGLAAGKGVVVCQSKTEAELAIDSMMVRRQFGDSGSAVVIEEALEGEEASILAFCDGKNILMMPSAQDHKRIGDGDTGPNTGGMGAYSPAPVITENLANEIEETIIRQVVKSMSDSGICYKGILYAGLMMTDQGPKVLEFNCRFGDPECQPIMARMEGDIVPVLMACINGDLDKDALGWSDRASVCVVMASGGYPGAYEKGAPISGLDDAGAMDNVIVFHAGARLAGDSVVTSGGRVLGVTATGVSVEEAIETAYAAVSRISFRGAIYRKDIGRKAVSR